MPTLHLESTAIGAAVMSRDDDFASPVDIRTAFTWAMSTMYRNEVPLYDDLVRIVHDVNTSILSEQPDSTKGTLLSHRLDIERHGAIRLGTPHELRTVARLFSILGLKAVGYYDLSIAGLPVHAACFRPVDSESLNKNPFRVFTTLLRPELISKAETRDLASKLLSRRNIFSPKLLELINSAERQSWRLKISDVDDFIVEAMKTFSWRPEASASEEEYRKLANEHPILADIASFKSAHINHLTPRTLDITRSQEKMRDEGLKVKDRIEGPPLRQCPILLRQTSFLALEERIKFQNSQGALVDGTHRARFGEIEERGAAVTPAGRKLYDELLNKAMSIVRTGSDPQSSEAMDTAMCDAFKDYPDSWSELRKRGLIYCTYHRTDKDTYDVPSGNSLEDLVDQGYLRAEPITYEDFLPFSAAGIFTSNLGDCQKEALRDNISSDQRGFESALGYALLDVDDLYRDIQRKSIMNCGLDPNLFSTFRFK
ncbi:hypothetical protein FOVG_17767 [Fusarium oxysporum f. sp. pisi HDV247]|uniref:2-oxoadipate dioxygenase/decarboxylase n=1 Tax=Fusarium oxysporum f. sp. pisi HDV247 TaxID=1080344 RepID=W9NJI2_FUSOX|nr:hypothetical protein FOVG_17767 [Fusarium oxysporum f. sp. pisi HDV247]